MDFDGFYFALASIIDALTNYSYAIIVASLFAAALALCAVLNLAHRLHNERRQRIIFENDKEFLTALLNNVDDGILACDDQGKLVLFNRVILKIFDLSPQQINSTSWLEQVDFYLPDGKTLLGKHEMPLLRALRYEKIQNFELIVKSKQQTEHNVLVDGQVIVNKNGKKYGKNNFKFYEDEMAAKDFSSFELTSASRHATLN